MSYLGLEQQLLYTAESIVDNFRKYEFVATQNQTTFRINFEYNPYKFLLYINGYLIPSDEYTITDYVTYFELVLDEGLNLNDIVNAFTFGGFEAQSVGVASHVEEHLVSANLENTFAVTFSTDIRNNTNNVYYNGIRISENDFTVNANSFTLNTSTSLNDVIILESFVSDNVIPEYRKVNVTPFVGGYNGVPVANYSGGGLELRRIKTSSDITATLNADHEIELGLNSFPVKTDMFTANGSTSVFSLQYQPYSSYSSIVTIDGVFQTPEVHYSMDVANSTLTFGSNPNNGSIITAIHLQTTSNTATLNEVSDNVISTIKIQNDAVTPEKIKNPWLKKTSGFTAYDGYKYIVDASSANIIVFLPSVRNVGDQFTIVNMTTNVSGNLVTIVPDVGNGDTIENKTSIVVYGENTSIDVVFNGTQWVTAHKDLSWGKIAASINVSNFGKFLVDSANQGAYAVNLPANPFVGEEISFHDDLYQWAGNNLTLNGNGNNIANASNNNGAATYVCNVTGSTVKVVWSGTLWKAIVSN